MGKKFKVIKYFFFEDSHSYTLKTHFQGKNNACDMIYELCFSYLQVSLTEPPSGTIKSLEVSSCIKSGGITTSRYPI